MPTYTGALLIKVFWMYQYEDLQDTSLHLEASMDWCWEYGLDLVVVVIGIEGDG